MSANFWPDTQRVEHAGFTFDIARAAIRNVTYEGAQLIDLVYTAIRPWDWSTLDPDEHTQSVEFLGENCVVTITDIFGSSMQGTTKLTIEPNGKFVIDYQLAGLERYEINRWGVCFCLHTGDWMGSSVLASGNTFKLLKEISPQRVIDGVTQGLFPASNDMHFLAPDQRSLKVLSTGKVLEAEDQRNWTDNTYKIYSGSLSEPRPFVIDKGITWNQKVQFEVTAPKSAVKDGSQIIAREISALPRIGVQFNEESSLAIDALEQALAVAVALLGVELRADHCVAADDGGDVAVIVDMGQTFCRIGHTEVVGVDEIGVIAGFQPVQHGVGVVDHQIVPAHVGHLERRRARGDANHFPRDPAKACGIFIFAAPCGHHLHADTDAQKRAGATGYLFFDRLEKATKFPQRAAAGGEGPIARQHDPVGAQHVFGARRDQHLARAGFLCHALEGLLGGMQVAGIVVDEDSEHLCILGAAGAGGASGGDI